MKKIFILITLIMITAQAGLPEKIAASFAAKYEICALKLKDFPKYKFKALGLKIKADKIHKNNLFKKGYLKALKKEKKNTWLISIKKCKKLANKMK